MAFNFEVLLVALTLLTGAIWAWDKWRRRQDPPPPKDEEAEVPWWLDLSRSLFPVIVAVLIIRSFIAEPFRIPSGSMIPTLFAGDFSLVNKFSYGLRVPAMHRRFLELGEPSRGDVAVFRYPVNPAQDYIKRVIGVPGDRIVYRDKQLFVNGEPQPQVELGPYTGPEREAGAQLLQEQLGAKVYGIVLHPHSLELDFEYVVPPQQYFVLGDNRDRSSDSRFWGPVPEENLVGRAFIVWMSWNPERKRINWSRIGERIQ